MNIEIAATILSHIVAPLYMAKSKYNKWITAFFWILYAAVSVCIVLTGKNEPLSFVGMLVAQLGIFFITAEGSVGEKLFLFLTYANSFCIFIGVGLFLTVFLGESMYTPVYKIGLIVLMNAVLYKNLIPIYQKARILFLSGWKKLNVILVLFFLQFLNQYAFGIVDNHGARGSVFDFVIFSAIFYSTLILIFSSVKDAAEINKKTLENYELKNMAYIDVLTKVKNRTAYMKYAKRQTLKHRENKDSRFICVVMDIDGFKSINDENGHSEGDKVLKNVGAIISEQFDDFICEIFRVGGDEFVLLTEHMELADIEEQMRIMNQRLLEIAGTTMSYGLSKVDFNNSKPFDAAFKNADKIMYENKLKKKFCF